MKIFGRSIRYGPEETAAARLEAVTAGLDPRRAARWRVYITTTECGRYEYRYVCGFLAVITMHLSLGLEYLFRRLKRGVSGIGRA
jgi:hypothetical protein